MQDTPSIKIAPSLLAADFARLGEETAAAAHGGADYIHVDVMDGHFVPPITFGAQMVAAIKAHAGGAPLDVHLMVNEPEHHVAAMAEAGADIIVVHVEASKDLRATLAEIHAHGARAGIALRPDTPLSAVMDVLDQADLLLPMTVQPGYGGQPYIEEVEQKVTEARGIIDARSLNVEIEVDGGINERTAARAARAGAHILVAGTAVYGRDEPVKERIALLRQIALSGLTSG